ncbi:hypothetical protein [Mycolicibacterium iranicum]|uniref:Uncharacterized protein n=1 Tax=Mycolicibacterium iranicum TaxID=912594 RepID=A0A178LTX3_MYCIR|nr:hypothetical protein [Mycolicibacterium iranicum]OAN36873.1 hypothetical protein A4X20_06720 [Mycolicibacterium iranicum]
MAATSPLTDTEVDRADARRPIRGRGTKHRLVALAGGTADTITSAGGFIFDRAAAGWDVDVYLADDTDDRPFRILGVRTSSLKHGVDTASQPDSVFVSATLYERDRATRRLFQKAAQTNHTEVAVWGGGWPRELKPGIGVVEHRLSLAALAFKAEAMKAAGVSAPCARTEVFHSGSYRVAIAAPLLAPA